jgi:hypothetical protein
LTMYQVQAVSDSLAMRRRRCLYSLARRRNIQIGDEIAVDEPKYAS